GRSLPGVELVNPVQNAQQGRLAAAGRAYERRHVLVVERQADVLEGLEAVIKEVDVAKHGLVPWRGLLMRGAVVRGNGRHGKPGGSLGRAHCLNVLHEASSRAPMLRNRTVIVISSAP